MKKVKIHFSCKSARYCWRNWIAKTKALSRYHLKIEDIKALVPIPNPRGRARTGTYYNIDEVEKLCVDIYGSLYNVGIGKKGLIFSVV
jgi:hypothetical protein